MRAFLRKCRGILSAGLMWSAAWSLIFLGLVLVAWLINPANVDEGEGTGLVFRVGATFGFVSGVVFSAVLAFADRRRLLRELSVPRAALWGAIGTSVIPLLTPVHNGMLLLVCPIGAALAAGTVYVARRAELAESAAHPELPPG